MSGRRARELRGKYEEPGRAGHYAAERWTRSRRARRSAAREERLVRLLLKDCGPLRRVLDLPCGAGRFHALLAAHAEQVVAADAALAMLREHPPTTCLAASADLLPLVDGCVDLVLCARLLHHFAEAAERRGILAELARVSSRWVIASYFDSASFQAWRNRVRGRFNSRFPVPRTVFLADADAAGLRLRCRLPLRRGISEQVWVLLEKEGV